MPIFQINCSSGSWRKKINLNIDTDMDMNMDMDMDTDMDTEIDTEMDTDMNMNMNNDIDMDRIVFLAACHLLKLYIYRQLACC